jgi:hypothetical protein
MKKIFLASAALVALAGSITLFQMTSCKKVIAQTTTSSDSTSIEGLWIGSYQLSGQPSSYFSFVIKPGGAMIVDSYGGSVENLGLGNWTLSGNALSCAFTTVYGQSFNVGITETATAVFDNAKGSLNSGAWAVTQGSTNAGTFSMSKVD